MTALEIKNDAINNLMYLNSKELLKQVNSILKCFVRIEKNAVAVKAKAKAKQNAKEKKVSEMTDKEYVDYIAALSKDNPMTAEEYKKLIIGSRVSGVTRNINYQALYNAKISD